MITNERIWTLLNHRGINPMAQITLDKLYAVPDQQSIADFWKRYADLLRQLDFWKYHAEDNDCDDFAIGAWWFMRAAWRRTKILERNDSSAAISFGIFGYQPSGQNQAHLINHMVDQDNIYFFEPQPQGDIPPGQPKSLTNEEAMSCFAYAI